MEVISTANPYLKKGIELIMGYGPKLLLAIVVLIVGNIIIKWLKKIIIKAMDKGKVEVSLQRFLVSLISIGLRILLLISVASMIGIATTSFVAILGATTFAIGLALQGSLSNFAGGVLILLLKPFKVGDVIEAQGYLGKVHEIQIFNTILKTFDNKVIYIPNGSLSNGNITNYSQEPIRRVDMTFGIGYGDDIKKAKDVLISIVEQDSRVLQDPAPIIAVSNLGDSSVDFAVKVWCDTAEYWNVFFDMQEKVKLTFDEKGISIPFPQTDVHLYKENPVA
ncbi:MAG TPA: mechanosensitive ion channel [Candidatus Cloacimonetes bacterium]|nr:mechanosensitive ion channel [Candidatus Cloacimonadota bacterium]HEX37631.1 mechanosensitive ion channel [Candidatus Cloacimonadota bacterium]